jgi:hypothetical protein
MRLLHLAAGHKYVVWAVCDGNACQVLDMFMKVQEEHPDLAEDMGALLFEVVPKVGPPLDDSRRAKRLYRDILYELKANKLVGGGKQLGFRVAFFFDGPSLIVCTNAFYKAQSTPQAALNLALGEQARYFEAKRRGELKPESVEIDDE